MLEPLIIRLAEKRLVIPNKVRAPIWAALVAASLLLGPRIDAALGLTCDRILCILLGLALLILSLRGAAVAGRYLAVYGRECGAPRGALTRLVKEGPYSCMRHPMHLALSLFELSIGLLAGSPGAVLVAAAMAALILVLAVILDEAESVVRFGEAYLEYRRSVPPVSLDPRCLSKLFLARRPPRRC